jgi:hypothetical protein
MNWAWECISWTFSSPSHYTTYSTSRCMISMLCTDCFYRHAYYDSATLNVEGQIATCQNVEVDIVTRRMPSTFWKLIFWKLPSRKPTSCEVDIMEVDILEVDFLEVDNMEVYKWKLTLWKSTFWKLTIWKFTNVSWHCGSRHFGSRHYGSRHCDVAP